MPVADAPHAIRAGRMRRRCLLCPLSEELLHAPCPLCRPAANVVPTVLVALGCHRPHLSATPSPTLCHLFMPATGALHAVHASVLPSWKHFAADSLQAPLEVPVAAAGSPAREDAALLSASARLASPVREVTSRSRLPGHGTDTRCRPQGRCHLCLHSFSPCVFEWNSQCPAPALQRQARSSFVPSLQRKPSQTR